MRALTDDHKKIITTYGLIPVLRELVPNVHRDENETKPQLFVLRRIIIFEPPLKDRYFQALEVPHLHGLLTDCRNRGIEISYITC